MALQPMCLGRRHVHICLCEVQSVCMSVYYVGPCLPWDRKEPSVEAGRVRMCSWALRNNSLSATLLQADNVHYRSKGRTQVHTPCLGWVVVKINTLSLKDRHVSGVEPRSPVPTVVTGPPKVTFDGPRKLPISYSCAKPAAHILFVWLLGCFHGN